MKYPQVSIDYQDKVELAIKRARLACDMSVKYYGKPLMVCYSGGKDSDALLEVMRLGGGCFEVSHSVTTCDAPETVRHVRGVFGRLRADGIGCRYEHTDDKDGRRVTMWNFIPRKLMPPTRLARYCCRVLKETGGAGRAIATGVRRSESSGRKDRAFANNFSVARPAKLDFEDAASLFERAEAFTEHDENFLRSCRINGRTSFQPIIDWSDGDVWRFLEERGVEYNPLYLEGFGRVGCIGCPFTHKRARMTEFTIWPQFMRAYKRAFGKMLDVRRARGLETRWETADEVFDWWVNT